MPSTWIPSAEAFGIPTEVVTLGPSGVVSAEAFGTADVSNSSVTLLHAHGIPSAEAFGHPTQHFMVDPGIPSAEAFGSALVYTTITTLLRSGTAHGTGTLTVGDLIGSGTALGTATLTPPTPILYRLGSGDVYGFGQLNYVGPLPVLGTSQVLALVEVIRVPRPFCPPRHDKVFRYGYILTQGDLALRVCDDSGNGFAPVVVLFAFYQIVPGGQRILVGPPNRRPVVDKSEGKVGRYYATGTAGELGQPGSWVVVWRYQRSYWTPTVTFEESFKVVDEVTSGAPGSLDGRCRKYGWL